MFKTDKQIAFTNGELVCAARTLIREFKVTKIEDFGPHDRAEYEFKRLVANATEIQTGKGFDAILTARLVLLMNNEQVEL